MRLSLLFNPSVINNRLAVAINRNNRRKLPNYHVLKLGKDYLCISELLAWIKGDNYIGKNIYNFGENFSSLTLFAKVFFQEGTIHISEPLEFSIQKISDTKVKQVDTILIHAMATAPQIVNLDFKEFGLKFLNKMGYYLNSTINLIIEVLYMARYLVQYLFLEIANYFARVNFLVYSLEHTTPIDLELAQIDVIFKKRK